MSTPAAKRDLSDWRRHFVYRKEIWRTTWKFRLSLALLIVLAVWAAKPWWAVSLAEGLTCSPSAQPGEALLVENFDPEPLVFARAAELARSGVSGRVLVPVRAAAHDPTSTNPVSLGITETLARVARLDKMEIIPVQEVEPITLNVAYKLRDFLTAHQVRSVTVLTQGFRSRRSYMVYSSVFNPAGISVSCFPVFGPRDATTWMTSWHGMEDVFEQFIKLQYYRFYVLQWYSRHAHR